MEPISWLVVVLLIFGGHEHIQKKEARAEVEVLELKLSSAKYELEKTIGVNETNADTITAIDNSRIQCVELLKETRERQADFDEINSVSEVRIEELEKLLDSYDWASVRIPAGLLDETSRSGNGN